jgi:hypothetical protein
MLTAGYWLWQRSPFLVTMLTKASPNHDSERCGGRSAGRQRAPSGDYERSSVSAYNFVGSALFEAHADPRQGPQVIRFEGKHLVGNVERQ